jgi:hypothetical protein
MGKSGLIRAILQSGLTKNCGRALKAGWVIPRGFGRGSPLPLFHRKTDDQSGRGLPQSKTLTRNSFT